MLGYSGIPDVWKSGIPAVADTKFDYTDYSYREIVESTMDRALEVVQRAGGRLQGDELIVPFQESKAPKLEQWNMGIPARKIEATDPAWIWKGDWADQKERGSRSQALGRATSVAGVEATLDFEGSAVILLGPYSQAGGKADVYLDGRKSGEINAWIPERTNDNALWHAYGLKPGRHTLRIVTRADADARSKGTRIEIMTALTFRTP
jgi:hypothetical protein